MCCAKSSRTAGHTTVTSPGASIGAACGTSLFTHYLWPCPASQFASLSPAVRESHTGCVHLSSGVWSVGCLCNRRPPISMDTAAGGKGQLLCHQCLLVSGGLALWPSQAWPFKSQCQLLRALCYYCVLPCAARFQPLNLVVKEQQAASWQGTFCSFLVYLPIPNDHVLGNNWHLPDLAVFMYPLANEVSSNGSEFAWSYPSLLGAAVSLCSGSFSV